MIHMKKLIAAASVMSLLFSGTVLAEENIAANEEAPTEAVTVIEYDYGFEDDGTERLMVPVRAMTTAFSKSSVITWDDTTKTVNIMLGNRIIQMTVDSRIMTVNGTQYNMTSSAMIVDSRIFIPLRDFCHALGISDDKISWDEETQTATIN